MPALVSDQDLIEDIFGIPKKFTTFESTYSDDDDCFNSSSNDDNSPRSPVAARNKRISLPAISSKRSLGADVRSTTIGPINRFRNPGIVGLTNIYGSGSLASRFATTSRALPQTPTQTPNLQQAPNCSQHQVPVMPQQQIQEQTISQQMHPISENKGPSSGQGSRKKAAMSLSSTLFISPQNTTYSQGQKAVPSNGSSSASLDSSPELAISNSGNRSTTAPTSRQSSITNYKSPVTAVSQLNYSAPATPKSIYSSFSDGQDIINNNNIIEGASRGASVRGSRQSYFSSNNSSFNVDVSSSKSSRLSYKRMGRAIKKRTNSLTDTEFFQKNIYANRAIDQTYLDSRERSYAQGSRNHSFTSHDNDSNSQAIHEVGLYHGEGAGRMCYMEYSGAKKDGSIVESSPINEFGFENYTTGGTGNGDSRYGSSKTKATKRGQRNDFGGAGNVKLKNLKKMKSFFNMDQAKR